MKKHLKRWSISLLHGLWMTLLVFLWLRQPYIFDYEFDATKDINDIEWYLRGGKVYGEDEYGKKFLFVNTSQSLVVDSTCAYNQPNVKTDRKQLNEFLEILNKNPNLYEGILFDVFVDELQDKDDSLLYNIIMQLKAKHKIATVNNIDENYYYQGKDKYYSVLKQNAFGTELSGTDFYPKSMSDAYYKFQYQIKPDEGDLQQQLPLLAYENMTGKQSSKPFFFDIFYRYKGDSKLYMNYYIPRIVLGYNDIVIQSDEEKENTIQLSWYYNSEDAVKQMLIQHKKPIIIIGDLLLGDLHYSTNGLIRGPLIAANAMIPLLNGGNCLHISYLLFLIIAFTIISYLTFYHSDLKEWKPKRIKSELLQNIISGFLDNLNYLILIIVTMYGIFMFNNYIFLIFNLLYIFAIEKLLDFTKKIIQKKSKS